MRRIGIEVQRLFREKKHGMEIVALELIKELQQLDNINEYVLFVKDDNDNNCVPKKPNWKIKILNGRTYFDWEQYSLPKAIKEEKIDFLHSTCNTSAIRLSVPLLLTLHDIYYLEHMNFKGTAYQNFGNLYRRFIVPKIAKKSRFIITVSDYERQVISDYLKIPSEKIKVVYNAVNSRFNHQYPASEVEKIRAKYALPESFILHLGNTAPQKNSVSVINAYVQYCRTASSPLPIVILDYPDHKIIEQLKAGKNEDLLEHFRFPGFIASEEMPLIYNAASLFLYPSLRESFGLPILEAMASGAPVITSRAAAMPEVAGDAALLVNPLNVEDISINIKKVLEDPVLQSELAGKGLERAKRFTWKKSAEDLLNIYEGM